MMEHNFTGRCALTIKRLLLVAGGCALLSQPLQAAPVETFSENLGAALASAEGAWSDSLLKLDQTAGSGESSPYDEQVFTELSPILDSPEAIRLPEDQLLSD